MELYIFDRNRTLLGVVEAFEYLRWTRRYSYCGSFELKAIATAQNVELLQIGHYLWKRPPATHRLCRGIHAVARRSD